MKRFLSCLAAGAALWLAGSGAAWGLQPEEQLRFADGIYLRGMYEAAAGEYLSYIKQHPEGEGLAAALYRTGECYRQMGNRTGAELFYRRVGTECGDSPYAVRAAIRRAEGTLAGGDAAGASAQFEALLAGEAEIPADMRPAVLHYLAKSLRAQGKEKAARGAAERLLAEHPDSAYAAYAALELASARGAAGAGAEEMERYFRTAVASAGSAKAKGEALWRWGDWAYRRGDYRTAADTFRVLLAETPDAPRAADARLAAAWCLYFLDQPEESFELADAAYLVADSREAAAGALYLKACDLRKMNRDGEALGLFRQVWRDFPQTAMGARAGYEILLTHFRRGEWEAALEAVPARVEERQQAAVLWMRAECERELGHAAAAKRLYETLGREAADSGENASALMRLGEAARAEGDAAGAAELFAAAAKHPQAGEERKAAALEAEAACRLSAGDAAGSAEAWERRLAMNPEGDARANALLQEALAVMELGDKARAGELLAAAIDAAETAGPRGRAAYWQGVLAAGAGDGEGAVKAFRAALADGVDGQTAALARLRLTLALQGLDRMDEAADEMEPLSRDKAMVAENPALAEWFIRQRFDQGAYGAAKTAGRTLAGSGAAPAWCQIGWYWAGQSAAALGEDREAEEAFAAAVAIPAQTREGVEARLFLARAALVRGDAAGAKKRYEEAGEAAREDMQDLRARAYFGLGEAAAKAGDLDEAVRHYMSVAVLFDDPELAPRALAAAVAGYDELGKVALRDAAVEELLKRYPDSAAARQFGETLP
jgi:TolA-binding protein